MNTKIRSFAFCLTACLLACSQSWSQRGPQDNWYLEKKVSLPTLQGFDQPRGLSFSSSGDLYVANGDYDFMSVWGPDGKMKKRWGSDGSGDGQFKNVHAVHVHGNEVFAADYDNHRVQVFDLNGTFKRKFGSYGSGDGQLRKPISIFVNSNGLNGPEVYVGDHDNNRISVFDLNGTFLRRFGTYGNGTTQFNRPFGITVSPNGELFISSTYHNTVRVWDKNGTYLRQFNAGMRAFNLAFSGDKLVVAGGENHKLKIFETNGTLLKTIGTGSASSAPGEFNYPWGVAVDTGGDIHVSCIHNDRIQVFDINGTYKRTYGYYGGNTLNLTGALATLEGTFIMSCNVNHQVVEIDENASVLRTLAGKGTADGRVSSPYFLSMDSQNRIYVPDRTNHRIQVLDRNGTFIRKFGTFGTGDGQFNNPVGTAISQQNELFVTDFNNHRVQVFDLNGTFIRKWGTQGTLDGQLKQPYGIAVDDADQVYVAEYGGNNRVSVFSTTGQFLYKFGTSGSRNDIVWISLTPTGLLLTGGETTGSYQNLVRLREKNGAFIKDWNLGAAGASNGHWSTPLQLKNGTIVAFDRTPKEIMFYKQTYRSLVFEPSKKPPLCEVISVTQAEGSSNIDIKYRITDADSSKVKAGLLAFVDGGNDLSKVIVPKTFVGSVAGKLDENTTTGVTHSVTWNAQADWNVTYGNIELAVVAQDDRDLMNLHFLTLPGTDSNSTELKINRSPLSNTDLLNAWYTLLALGDENIRFDSGKVVMNESNTSSQAGFSPANLSGLVAWFDATDINASGLSNQKTEGEQITLWVDKAGGDHNATATGSPTFSTSGLNGRNALYFDSSDRFSFNEINNIRTVFWVVKRTATGNYHFVLGHNSTADFHPGTSKIWYDSIGPVKSGVTRLSGRVVNGAQESIPNTPFILSAVTSGNAKASMISYDRTHGRSWRGFISEILVFSEPLTQHQVADVEKYLAFKWGLTYSQFSPLASSSTTYAAGREYLFNKMNLRQATSAEITRAKEAATPGMTNKFTPTFKVGPGERPEKVNEYNFETQQTGYWVVPKN